MACAAVLPEHRPLHLDVAGLQFADEAGIGILRRLQHDGVRFAGSSPLVEALLDQGGLPAADRGASDGDADLVVRLKAGDAAAFETMVRRHAGRMLSTARRMLATEDDARDVVQEALLSAYRSIRTFEGSSRLSTWLHRVVVNSALMRLRSGRRRREDSIEDLLPRFGDDGHFAEPIAAWEETAEVLLSREETRAMVRRAIGHLPPTYRAVLVLRDIEELDTEETAAVLGVRPNAVKTRLHRARQALRTLIEREVRGGRQGEEGARATAA